MDFGKALGLHRLYGHKIFMQEIKRHNPNKRFIQLVCLRLSCQERERITS